MQKERINYGIRVHDHPNDIDSELWDALLALQTHPTPFMRHGYLLAVHESQSAVSATGWQAQWISVWAGEEMVAACPLYVKPHSYGEYVFDWAWARAYQQHGLDYYPKAVIAVPFTPVPGSRLLARDAQTLGRVVTAAFTQRRKTLRNALGKLIGEDGLRRLGIDPGLRPENLSVADYVAISNSLAA